VAERHVPNRLISRAVVLLALSGCVATSDISRARARDLVAHGAQLVDVRSPGEFAERHPDAAINIPLESITLKMDALDRRRPVIVYCHTGVRAAIAARRFRRAGFGEVYNLGTVGHWYYERVGVAPSFE